MSQSNPPPSDPPLPKTVFLTPGAENLSPPQPFVPEAPPAAPLASPPAVFQSALPLGYRAAIARPARGANHDGMHPLLPRERQIAMASQSAEPAPAPAPVAAPVASPRAAPAAPATPVARAALGQPIAAPSGDTPKVPRRKSFEDDIEADFGPMTSPAPAGAAAAVAHSLNGQSPQPSAPSPEPGSAPWAQQTPHLPRAGSSGFTGFPEGPRTGVAQGVAIAWNGNPWSLLGLGALNGLLSMLTMGVYRFWGTTEVRKRIWSFIRLEGEPLAYTGTGGELFKGFLIVFFGVLMPLFLGPLLISLLLGDRSFVGPALTIVAYIAIFYLTGVAIYRGWDYRLARTNWRGIRGSLNQNSWRYGWSYFWTGGLIGILLGLGYAAAVGVVALIRPTNPITIAGLIVAGLIIAVIPALLLVPWRSTKLNRELTNDMRFGARPFSFTGIAKPLYSSFIARWVGVLLLILVSLVTIFWLLGSALLAELPGMPTQGRRPSNRPGGPMADVPAWRIIGVILVVILASFIYSIISAWYRAVEANYFAAHTHYENATFQLDIKGRGLVWIAVTNWLIQMIGIGIILLGGLLFLLFGGSAIAPGGTPPIGAIIVAFVFYIVGYFALVAVRPVIQARTLRYYVDNIRLIGPIDAAGIVQNEMDLSRSGEGLAGAFDVAF